ncbi:hypothetical protein J31TS4_12050 [Paenibacillus sp. J31TS4]|uniref:hypothetical protein n=1 Tax=Paenibacillus sp. J31TS4 TaxID=2807195 RepID=UPI001AFCD8F2|nr:hypothetical protein [Paenibacillus sp. J31TS4]GIP37925.1 hypothetical protein J31TS4_12050 [Paenibacillus sp. J31TS4]
MRTKLLSTALVFALAGSYLVLAEHADSRNPSVLAAGMTSQLAAEAQAQWAEQRAEPSQYIKEEFIKAGGQVQPGLHDSIARWVSELAAQPGFEAWRDADWELLPLGPGLHGWSAIVKSGGREVGYLIVSANQDASGGFRLLEYGTGTKPLYSLATLYQALVQHELIDPLLPYDMFQADLAIRREPIYYHALLAVWKVTAGDHVYYLDAKSGDLLPDLTEALRSLNVPFNAAELPALSEFGEVAETRLLDVFDPLGGAGWVKGPSLPDKGATGFMRSLEGSRRLTYTARLLEDKLLYPFAVTGYQLWKNGETFFSLDHDGSRFIPYELLQQNGGFSSSEGGR